MKKGICPRCFGEKKGRSGRTCFECRKKIPYVPTLSRDKGGTGIPFNRQNINLGVDPEWLKAVW